MQDYILHTKTGTFKVQSQSKEALQQQYPESTVETIEEFLSKMKRR